MSTTDLGARLLQYLRTALQEPGLAFAEAPAAISGGFDTRIYGFRLTGASPALSGALILRLLGPQHDPSRVLRERATQNALVELGYPAPRVFLATADPGPLGGPFLVMDRLSGKVLPDASFLGMGRILADLQAQLHALDPEHLLRALARDGVPPSLVLLDGHLAHLARRIAERALEGLQPVMAWLLEHRPREERPRVICHGDFHPYNILSSGARVTGVIDWANAMVADPALDVAATKTILSFAPVAGLPWTLRWFLRAARPLLVQRYLRGYRRRRAFDPANLSYYEVASCMRTLIRLGEDRLRAKQGALDTPSFRGSLMARVLAITGLTVQLPPTARR